VTFHHLFARAQACRLCPRMAGRTRVMGPANGPLDARLLFVAEAPGRLGADRTGVPLSADQTGRNFAAFLAAAGLNRDAMFVTNAVICNPRGNDGRNSRPTARETSNCSPFLRELIDLLDPPWVVALGRVALESLGLISTHGAVLARDVAKPIPWHRRTLVPLYHPGPRSVARRTRDRQQEDYAQLAALVRASGPCVAPPHAGEGSPTSSGRTDGLTVRPELVEGSTVSEFTDLGRAVERSAKHPRRCAP
jgi:uracil-DNA glycosylase